jgi:DNA-binding IclR family transcriptional regulator
MKPSRPRGPEPAGSSKSLQKAMRILLHLAECGPEMGITQLAAELHLNKTTVYRLLNAMAKFEVIEKNSDNERYRLGLRLHALGCRALESRSLRTEVHQFLVELSRRCNESVSFAVPGAGGVVCLDRVDAHGTVITARTPVGCLFQPHCTAAGKAILAYLPVAEVDAIIERNGMRRFTPNTIGKYSQLQEVLVLTRHQGYATDREELETGLSGLAAAVFMRGSQPLGALGIAGPSPRFVGEELKKRIHLIKDFATRISKTLGSRDSELPGPARALLNAPIS